MLARLDDALLAAAQSAADRATLRHGTTSLEVSLALCWAYLVLGLASLASASLAAWAGMDVPPPLSNPEQAWQTAAKSALHALVLLVIALPRMRDLGRAARGWRESWEAGRLCSRPALSPSAGTRSGRVFFLFLALAWAVLSAIEAVPQLWLGNAAAMPPALFCLCWSFHAASLYMEAVMPRPPGRGREKKRADLPAGAVAAREG